MPLSSKTCRGCRKTTPGRCSALRRAPVTGPVVKSRIKADKDAEERAKLEALHLSPSFPHFAFVHLLSGLSSVDSRQFVVPTLWQVQRLHEAGAHQNVRAFYCYYSERTAEEVLREKTSGHGHLQDCMSYALVTISYSPQHECIIHVLSCEFLDLFERSSWMRRSGPRRRCGSAMRRPAAWVLTMS